MLGGGCYLTDSTARPSDSRAGRLARSVCICSAARATAAVLHTAGCFLIQPVALRDPVGALG
jgi:hypothetical protein